MDTVAAAKRKKVKNDCLIILPLLFILEGAYSPEAHAFMSADESLTNSIMDSKQASGRESMPETSCLSTQNNCVSFYT